MRSALTLTIPLFLSNPIFPASAQGYDPWTSLWGPGRKATGDLFHSAAEPLPDGPFRWKGDRWSLALGGQYFTRVESRQNADFKSAARDDDTFVEQRARLSVRASLFDVVGFVLEYQDVRIWGAERNTVTTEPFTGLHQGYLDLRPRGWFNLRVGRQELCYGEDRLLGCLDWAMSARAFDGAFVRFSAKDFSVDLFGMLVRERAFLTDPSGARLPNEGAQLYGVYSRWRASKRWGLDVYALGLVSDPTTIALGTRGERGFATLGGRAFASLGPFYLMGEGAYQVGKHLDGTHGDSDLSAWAVAAKVVYTTPFWGKPYFAFEYLRASGDGDPHDGTYTSFNQLFPTAHLYLGYADYVGWQNVQGYRATIGWRPWGAHVWVDVHRMEMVEPRGAWFNAAGQVFIPADPGRHSFVMGTELDVSVTVPLHKHVALAGAYALFLPGDAAASRGSDASHWGFLYLRSQF